MDLEERIDLLTQMFRDDYVAPLRADLDEFRIWNRAPTLDEVEISHKKY